MKIRTMNEGSNIPKLVEGDTVRSKSDSKLRGVILSAPFTDSRGELCVEVNWYSDGNYNEYVPVSDLTKVKQPNLKEEFEDIDDDNDSSAIFGDGKNTQIIVNTFNSFYFYYKGQPSQTLAKKMLTKLKQIKKFSDCDTKRGWVESTMNQADNIELLDTAPEFRNFFRLD